MLRPETEHMFGPGPLIGEACAKFASFQEVLTSLRSFLEGNRSRGKADVEEKEEGDGWKAQHVLNTSGSPPNDHCTSGGIVMSYWRAVTIGDAVYHMNEYQTYSLKTELNARHRAQIIVHLDGNIKLPFQMPLTFQECAIGQPLVRVFDEKLMKFCPSLATYAVLGFTQDDMDKQSILQLDYRDKEREIYNTHLAYEHGRPKIEETNP